MKKLVILLLIVPCFALAQVPKSRTAIKADIVSLFPDQNAGYITPLRQRTIVNEILDASYNLLDDGAPLASPMTTLGDMIVGGASGVASRLAAGTNGYVLTMVSGVPTWALPSGGGGGGSGTVTSVAISGGTTGLTFSGSPVTTSGTMTAGGVLAIANGGTGTATPGLVQGANVTITGTWPNQTIAASASSGMTNPMTTAGDIIIGASGGAPARVAAGTNGNVLTMVSGAPAWGASSGSGLPTQTGNAGKAIMTDGTSASWVTPGSGLILGASTQNFVFEGDSQTADDASGHTDYPYQLMNTANQFIGRGTKANFATSGNVMSNVTSRYASNVFPLRPTGSVVQSWLFLWIGANDICSSDATTFNAAWDSYVNTAVADGFKVVAFTIPNRNDGFIVAGSEAMRIAINDHIRKSNKWTYLIPCEQIVPDINDASWSADAVHFNAAARVRLAKFINNAFVSAGALNTSSTVTIGSTSSAVPTNAILTGTAREYSKAQGQTEAALTSGSSVNWDLDAAQSAYLNLGVNALLVNPTNIRPGLVYKLIVKGAAHTLSYDTAYKFTGGTAPVLDTTANRVDLFEFLAHGTDMLCIAHTSTPITIAGGGNIILDGFSVNGTMAGSTPDTIDTPASPWTDGATSVTKSGGVATATATASAQIQTGVADFSVEANVTRSGSGLAGIMARWTDDEHYFLLCVDGVGTYTLYRRTSAWIALGSGSYTSVGADLLKIVCTGTTIKGYINGGLIATVTDAQNSTTAVAGLRSVNSGTFTWDNFRVY